MVKVYRNFSIIFFVFCVTAQLHGMESDFAMDKQDAPTNVEIPTLQVLCLQKFCKEIQETLDEEGIQEAEQLAYLNPEIVAPELANQIKKELVQVVELYTKSMSLKGHNDCVSCLVYNEADKRLFSGSDDCIINIWDTNTGVCTQTLKGHTDRVQCLVYDAASKRLFSGSNEHTIRIWDTSIGTCAQTLESHTDNILCLVYDAVSNRLFSGSNDCTINIWNTNTGTCIQTLEGHIKWVACLVYDTDNNRLFSGSGDCAINIWDTNTGTCTQILKHHTNWTLSLVYDAVSKRLFSGSSDKTVRIWQPGSFAYTLCTLAVCSVKDKDKLDNVKASQTYQQLSDEEKEAIDRHIKRLKQ
ncbi:MAG TPA: WD40 repeat domain-containing protein [Candidatus Dependentiae bacterium]|nr:WD40 repeat domain-containing protein [Candidatus Dependentiae bacterium]HRQ63016.1 WD40 repeat domain-containing protein [Candidatus Dependentiae bacterium]